MGRHRVLTLVAAVVWLAARPTAAQAPTGEEIDRAHRMLAQVRDDLLKYYYDSTFGGVNLDVLYVTSASINLSAEDATSYAKQAFSVIAALARCISERSTIG